MKFEKQLQKQHGTNTCILYENSKFLKRVVYSFEEIDVQSYIPGEDLFSSFLYTKICWRKLLELKICQQLSQVIVGYTPTNLPLWEICKPEVENISVYLSTDDFQGRSLLGAGSFGKAISVVLGWNFLYQIWVVSYWICFPCEFCLIDLYVSC